MAMPFSASAHTLIALVHMPHAFCLLANLQNLAACVWLVNRPISQRSTFVPQAVALLQGWPKVPSASLLFPKYPQLSLAPAASFWVHFCMQIHTHTHRREPSGIIGGALLGSIWSQAAVAQGVVPACRASGKCPACLCAAPSHVQFTRSFQAAAVTVRGSLILCYREGEGGG